MAVILRKGICDLPWPNQIDFMDGLFEKEPNYRRAIMLLANEWAPKCGRSMALRYAWHQYHCWKAEKAEREEAARAAFFNSHRERRQAQWWKKVRDSTGRLPVTAVERRECERPIMGRKAKGIPFEFYRCRRPEERVSA